MPKSRAAAIRLPGTGWRSLSIFLSSRSTSLFYPSGAGWRRGVSFRRKVGTPGEGRSQGCRQSPEVCRSSGVAQIEVTGHGFRLCWRCWSGLL